MGCWSWWNHFFHARAGSQACLLAGWIRIAYACLILCDRLLLTLDFEWLFFDVMPYEATSKHPILQHNYAYTLFQLAPDTPALYYGLHWLGVVQAVLLMLGVAPKFQLLCLHVNMVSFHHHNTHIWDGEDLMFRLWSFHLLFLPMHRMTVYEWLGIGNSRSASTNAGAVEKSDETDDSDATEVTVKDTDGDSWPMWPFRLFQISVCHIYMGAGIAKLANERWRSGLAMWHIVHADDFFGGVFTPDFLFNRLGPLMFLSYSSLTLENSCWVLIWPKLTRKPMLISMLLLHLGIDLAMNMHCFEWLSMLGWLTFLVEEPIIEVLPSMTSDPTQDYGSTKPSTTRTTHGTLRRLLVNAFIVIVWSTFFIDAVPLNELSTLVPAEWQNPVRALATHREHLVDTVFLPILNPLGLQQGVWSMFCNAPDGCFRYEAFVRFSNDTETTWLNLGNGPSNMAWYERKRWQRPLSFYDNYNSAVNDPFTAYLARLHGPDVASVELWLHEDTPPEYPPETLGWFEPAMQHRERNSNWLYTYNICDDLDNRCEDMAEDGLCEIESRLVFMMNQCRYSCDWCFGVEDIEVGSRIALFWEDDGGSYSATVNGIQDRPKQWLLDYDQYDEGEQFEWIDAVSLRRRLFRFVGDEDDDDSADDSADGEEEEGDVPQDQENSHDDETNGEEHESEEDVDESIKDETGDGNIRQNQESSHWDENTVHHDGNEL